MTTTLYFVRHGETLWNAEKRMQGHLNSDLTTAGINQATLLGEAFKNETIAKCYVSDSPRATATAALVTTHLPITIEETPALREIAMGSWEGQTREVIQKNDAVQWQRFWEEPHLFAADNGGETFSALESRSTKTLKAIIKQHPGEKILIVSHRLTIKTMINHLLQEPLDNLNQLTDVLPNSLTIMEVTNQETALIRYSDVSHYTES